MDFRKKQRHVKRELGKYFSDENFKVYTHTHPRSGIQYISIWLSHMSDYHTSSDYFKSKVEKIFEYGFKDSNFAVDVARSDHFTYALIFFY